MLISKYKYTVFSKVPGNNFDPNQHMKEVDALTFFNLLKNNNPNVKAFLIENDMNRVIFATQANIVPGYYILQFFPEGQVDKKSGYKKLSLLLMGMLFSMKFFDQDLLHDMNPFLETFTEEDLEEFTIAQDSDAIRDYNTAGGRRGKKTRKGKGRKVHKTRRNKY